MKLGFPEFGAFISPGKTLCSFEFASGSQVAPVCMGPDGKSCQLRSYLLGYQKGKKIS